MCLTAFIMGKAPQGLSAVWQGQRGERHCHMVGMCSFKNMNSAHCKGVTNALDKQGSESLLKLQTREEGWLMRGFGYVWEVSVDMI